MRLSNPKVQGAFHHLLSTLGPLLAAHGVQSEAYWQMVAGSITAALAFYLSITAPKKNLEPS